MKLSHLLAPLDVPTFLERHWSSHALSLSGRPDRLAHLEFDFDELVRHVRSRPRATILKAQFFDPRRQHREMEVSAGQMRSCFDAGMTICFGFVETLFPGLAAQARTLAESISFLGRAGFNCYWSPPGTGFGLHYDDHDVFILQVAGAKRWFHSRTPATPSPPGNLVYSPEAVAELRGRGVRVSDPSEQDLVSTLLQRGDLLYLPAGTWHKTTAEGCESIALTLQLVSGRPVDVIERRLHTLLVNDVAWRRALPIADPADSDGVRAVEEAIVERLAALKSLVSALTSSDLVNAVGGLMPKSDTV